MEQINIAELLKDAPRGTKLWSPLVGDCRLEDANCHTIHVSVYSMCYSFDNYGYFEGIGIISAECLLFPSKDHRTWRDFKPSWKPEHKVFKPGQPILVPYPSNATKDGQSIIRWKYGIYSHWDKNIQKHCSCYGYYKDSDIISYEGNEALLGKEVEE